MKLCIKKEKGKRKINTDLQIFRPLFYIFKKILLIKFTKIVRNTYSS